MRFYVGKTQHPWRIIFAALAGVLLCAVAIQTVASHAGDAVLAAMDAHNVTVTGVVAEEPAGSLCLVADTHSIYHLDSEAVRRFTGQRVRISGVLHEHSRILDVKAISAFDRPATSGLDRRRLAL